MFLCMSKGGRIVWVTIYYTGSPASSFNSAVEKAPHYGPACFICKTLFQRKQIRRAHHLLSGPLTRTHTDSKCQQNRRVSSIYIKRFPITHFSHLHFSPRKHNSWLMVQNNCTANSVISPLFGASHKDWGFIIFEAAISQPLRAQWTPASIAVELQLPLWQPTVLFSLLFNPDFIKS